MSGSRKSIKLKRMAKEVGGSSSSGSDHFTSGSLSDLVNSFIQRVEEDVERDDSNREEFDDSDKYSSSNEERKELLKKLLGYEEEEEDDSVAEFRRNIIQEIEGGFLDQINTDPTLNRRLMVHLRDRGYDAGVCKSRWEKSKRYPGGTYEYVDIIRRCNNSGGSCRYIVEVLPAGQFEIARPTEGYTAMLQEFPCILIMKPETLKQMVRVMSLAMKESLKSNGLKVAPWRRNGYLQAQWFGPYKRTTIEVSTRSTPVVGSNAKIRRTVVGFVEDMRFPAPNGGLVYNCNRQFSSRATGFRVGLLATAFQGKLCKSTPSN